MKTKIQYGTTFYYLFRKWWVVNWDDTDQLWICQDSYRNIRFLSTEKIQEILFRKLLTKPQIYDIIIPESEVIINGKNCKGTQ